MKKFTRNIRQSIQKWLKRSEIIILYGARQVGKTTLVHTLMQGIPQDKITLINGDNAREHELLNFSSGVSPLPLTKNKDILIIDEAQKIPNLGTNLKILYDSNTSIKIIVTGSSSIDIAQAVSESLTGRMIDFQLYPLCLDEIHQYDDIITLSQHLNEYMIYGMYPGVVTEELEFKKDKIRTIANNYLYKDILQIEGIKKPDIIIKLLKLLALQIGNQVSYHELATKLQIHQETVIKYIELLEKTFVIFRLHARSGNIRNELTKSVKIYFWDLGIRNAILQDRIDINHRSDAGHIWENFIIAERIKYLQSHSDDTQFYFWRNYQQQEIDLVEVSGGKIQFLEIKQNDRKNPKLPNTVKEAYPHTSFNIINSTNWWQYLLDK